MFDFFVKAFGLAFFFSFVLEKLQFGIILLENMQLVKCLECFNEKCKINQYNIVPWF